MKFYQVSLFIASSCMAANVQAFFCPTNFSQIALGNTQAQIDEICGKPAKIVERTEKPADNTPQEWSYFVKQSPALGSVIPGNIKATIAFDQTGKVINMTVNGLSISRANFCGNQVIQIGSSRDEVKKQCGVPSYVNRGENPGAPPTVDKKMVDYQYDSRPPVTLTFQNGILVERK